MQKAKFNLYVIKEYYNNEFELTEKTVLANQNKQKLVQVSFLLKNVFYLAKPKLNVKNLTSR